MWHNQDWTENLQKEPRWSKSGFIMGDLASKVTLQTERWSFDNPSHHMKQELIQKIEYSIFIFIFPLLVSYIIPSSTCLSSEEEDSEELEG